MDCLEPQGMRRQDRPRGVAPWELMGWLVMDVHGKVCIREGGLAAAGRSQVQVSGPTQYPSPQQPPPPRCTPHQLYSLIFLGACPLSPLIPPFLDPGASGASGSTCLLPHLPGSPAQRFFMDFHSYQFPTGWASAYIAPTQEHTVVECMKSKY